MKMELWRTLRCAALLQLMMVLAMHAQGPGTIVGRVLDARTGDRIEYANIVLSHTADSSLVTGAVSAPDGTFLLERIPAGRYVLAVSVIGYETKRLDVAITVRDPVVRLGDISVVATAILMEGVMVEGERSPVSYRIDKKIIDPEHLATSLGGSVVDVLETIPSVSVDIEGNVSLRGRGNFTLLIDGKPTIMDAQDALQQISATAVETIEIITNPSVKYDPEGTAGIINIMLKKSRAGGFSGMATANVGLNDKYGGDLMSEYRTDAVRAALGLNYHNRFFPGTEREERSYFFDDRSSFIHTSGDTRRGRISSGIRGELGIHFTEQDVLGMSGRFRSRHWENFARLATEEWSDPGLQHLYRTNIVSRKRGGESSSIGLDYRHRFPKKGHELTAYVQYEQQDSDELTVSELLDGQTIVSGRKTTEGGPSSELESKVEYVLPLGVHAKFEAGYQGETDISREMTGLLEYDPMGDLYEPLGAFSHDVRYEEDEHAAYLLYSGEAGNVGVQAGLRTEYTKRKTTLASGGPEFLVDRWDYFPSLHTSYRFADGRQVMASYTRRIDRPGGGQTEPFQTWLDANNVRQGNPSLIPEFIDSYELAAQTFFGPLTVSGELYYSMTQNKIQNVRTVYAENVTLRTPENIGQDRSLGVEFLLNFDLVKGWNVNMTGSVYDYRIEGTLSGEPLSRRSFNWRFGINNALDLGPVSQVQLSTRIVSPTVSPQGREKESIVNDLAIRHGFFNEQLTAILQIRNVFNARSQEFTSEGPGFHIFSRSLRESPMATLTLRLNLNRSEGEKEEDRMESQEFDSE